MLGIIGRTPKGLEGPSFVDSFRVFQRVAGELEAATPTAFPALHAVCHATMNGAAPLAFYGVEDIWDPAALGAALRGLRGAYPELAMVVVPGLRKPAAEPPVEQVAALVDAQKSEIIWLDAPTHSSADEIVAYREALPGDRDLVRVVTPEVYTISPGRRSFEALPPTCLIGPLSLGEAIHLRGMHRDLPALGNPDRKRLEEAGCGLLVSGAPPQKPIRLAFPPPLGGSAIVPADEARPEDRDGTLEGRIQAALDLACHDAVASGRSGPDLWKLIEREGRAVLARFVSSGELRGFRLRCDEETNRGMVSGVGVEVLVETPKRVRSVHVRMTVM